jgi:uncharacterized SAM-binding protein YcdF (DUF218 family)
MMTHAPNEISPKSAIPGPIRLSATALAFTIAVQVLAVFSAATGGFHRWIETRFTDSAAGLPRDALPGLWAWPHGVDHLNANMHWLAWPVNLLLWGWAISVLVHFLLLKSPSAQTPKRRRQRSRLLLPTYFLIAILLLNTIYYFRLYALGRLDSFQIPITAFAALLLGTWAALMLRAEHRQAAPRRFLSHAALGLCTTGLLGAAIWFFGFAFADSPPPPHAANGRPRLAVVFGNQVHSDGMPGQLMGDRTLTAIDLYRRGAVQTLLLSGACSGQDGTGMDEPAAMKRLCLAMGVRAEDLILDPVGINTRASVESTKQVLSHLPPTDVVAVSSPSHLPRIRVAYAQAGMSVYTVGAQPRDWGCEDLLSTAREMYAIGVYVFDPSYRAAKGVAMGITHPRLVVAKSANTMDLFDGDRLVKTYKCITGRNDGDKEIEGDKKTPLGHFHVVFKNPESKYHLSLGLDYPNLEDCQRGLKQGLITPAQYESLVAALQSDLSVEANQNVLWKSPLGGEIFIHGHGEGRDGTAGCVAVSNPEIEEIYAICDVGTEVEIRP